MLVDTPGLTMSPRNQTGRVLWIRGFFYKKDPGRRCRPHRWHPPLSPVSLVGRGGSSLGRCCAPKIGRKLGEAQFSSRESIGPHPQGGGGPAKPSTPTIPRVQLQTKKNLRQIKKHGAQHRDQPGVGRARLHQHPAPLHLPVQVHVLHEADHLRRGLCGAGDPQRPFPPTPKSASGPKKTS